MDRKGYIGSSDIAGVLGLSRWTTPLQLWAEKTGQVEPDDLSDNEAVEWGTRLEDPVAKKFADKHDVKVMAYKKRFVHPEHKFLSCELDRIITGTETIVEVKTCNAWKAKEWSESEYPDEYLYQVQFAMGLSGRKDCWMVVLIGGQKYVEKYIEFDQELFDMMVEKAVDFWRMVQDKIPPVAVYGDDEILAKLFPGNPLLDEKEVPEEDADWIGPVLRGIEEANESIKAKKQEREEFQNAIKQYLEDNELMNVDGRKVTWKSQSKTIPDTAKMKEDGIFDKYSKVSEFRVLRVGNPVKKEKQNE